MNMSATSSSKQETGQARPSSPTGTSPATTSVGVCPYAEAMMLRGSSTESLSKTTISSHHPTLPSNLPGVVEMKGCPAFSNSCPFKFAKSPQEISQKLSQIPPSHLEGQTHNILLQTLAYFHKASGSAISGSSDATTLNATTMSSVVTCPVRGLVPKDWSFDTAMEDFSLASIMSRLAEQHEVHAQDSHREIEKVTLANNLNTCQNDNDHDEDHHKDENLSTGTTSSFETLGSLVPPSQFPATYDNSSHYGNNRLSEALRTGTAAAHEAAESVHFVKNFIRGKIDRDLYALLLAQLFHVYQRMEELLERHAPQYFPACHFPRELERLPALKEDVAFWYSFSDCENDKLPLSPATQDYLERLDKLARDNPLLLLAHAYTRYLGDLSGGKILGRVARRALKLDKNGDGLAFYHFPRIESAKKFKDHYRRSLNELALDDDQVQALVQEANVAFLLNMRLFEELDVHGGVVGASVRDLNEVYNVAAKNATRFGDATEGDHHDEQAPCPFAHINPASADVVTGATLKRGTCPWPFILLHDPIAGMKHHETWLVIICIAVAFLYGKHIS